MRIAIYGYGNLGRGVEAAARMNADCELVGIFTRRGPGSVRARTDVPVYAADELAAHKGEIDVLILCGGSATDLPELTPALAREFCVVDSFDTHANIPTHFARVDEAAKAAGTLCLISAGWDPGMFSIARVYAQAILPDGRDYTFWGRGVSQGHSDAIRRIPGVLDARQYTVPVPAALDAVGAGENPELSTREKHTRECYVVAAPDADREAIREAIVTMPNYFVDYDTTVIFITAEEMARDHAGLPHGGRVIRNGRTGLDGEHTHTVSYSLRLDSNPEFTASALVCFARAVYRQRTAGRTGCMTVLDVAPAELSPLSGEELRAHML